MRVVAGAARGRRLVAPSGFEVRPTSDRVREAVFNALGSMGVVSGASVVDLFAGSGALGVEALSRGAARCTFVDDSPTSLDAVRANLTATGLGDRAEVVRADAQEWVSAGEGRWDLALVDPPYRFDGWRDLLETAWASLLVAESDRVIEAGPPWRVLRERSYGTTVVTFLVPEGYPPVTGRALR